MSAPYISPSLRLMYAIVYILSLEYASSLYLYSGKKSPLILFIVYSIIVLSFVTSVVCTSLLSRRNLSLKPLVANSVLFSLDVYSAVHVCVSVCVCGSCDKGDQVFAKWVCAYMSIVIK